jgi:hypothetical protein
MHPLVREMDSRMFKNRAFHFSCVTDIRACLMSSLLPRVYIATDFSCELHRDGNALEKCIDGDDINGYSSFKSFFRSRKTMKPSDKIVICLSPEF